MGPVENGGGFHSDLCASNADDESAWYDVRSWQLPRCCLLSIVVGDGRQFRHPLVNCFELRDSANTHLVWRSFYGRCCFRVRC